MTHKKIAHDFACQIYALAEKEANNGMLPAKSDLAALILSAAARIVKESGAVEAMRLASLNYKRTNHSNPDMMMDDEHEAWAACNTALASLRSLTELGEGKQGRVYPA